MICIRHCLCKCCLSHINTDTPPERRRQEHRVRYSNTEQSVSLEYPTRPTRTGMPDIEQGKLKQFYENDEATTSLGGIESIINYTERIKTQELFPDIKLLQVNRDHTIALKAECNHEDHLLERYNFLKGTEIVIKSKNCVKHNCPWTKQFSFVTGTKHLLENLLDLDQHTKEHKQLLQLLQVIYYNKNKNEQLSLP